MASGMPPTSLGDEEQDFLLQRSEQESRSSQDVPDIQTSTVRDGAPSRHLGLLSTIFLITNRMIGTAIFSTPSSIAASVGSAGAALVLWLVGLLLSYCGMLIWIELGWLMPRSGGEKIYLEAAYPRPPMLMATMYAVFVILLGFTGIGSVVIAENLLLAIHGSASDGIKRVLAMIILGAIAAVHIYSRTWGVRVMNTLASAKIIVLVLIILSGLRALLGDLPQIPQPGSSLRDPFAGSPTNVSNYTTALFKILASYQGWTNAAYVLDEVKDPRRTLRIAGIVGVGTVGGLYLLTNLAYFIVATPEEISQTGVTVVALLIGKVFGDTMMWIAAILAALSSLGNLLTASFTMSRVVRQFAQEGILPGGAFFASTTASGSPSWAFALVFLSSAIMIALVPFGQVYNFNLDVGQYAVAIVNLLVVIGLFIIRTRTTQPQPFRAWNVVVALFLATQIFLLITPFTPGLGSEGTPPAIPSWMPPIVSIAVFLGTGVYWYASPKSRSGPPRRRPSSLDGRRGLEESYENMHDS